MRIITIALALTLATTPLLAAKGSGGHGGGGGHASGGRSAGGHTTAGHATARSSGGQASGGGARTSTAQARGESSGGSASAARPRNGRPAVGSAVPRTNSTPAFVPSRPATVTPLFVRPYLVRPNFLGFGFGGLGSFYIPYGSWYDDPFYSYYGSPYYGSPFGYPYAGGAPLGGGATTYAPLPFAVDDDEMGKLRLQIDQRLAQVYVDGYYAGIVDEFDGTFQHLDLTPGPHHIQIEQAGYATLSFDVNIVAHRKTDYRAKMAPASVQ
jgi:hypothetical protein